MLELLGAGFKVVVRLNRGWPFSLAPTTVHADKPFAKVVDNFCNSSAEALHRVKALAHKDFEWHELDLVCSCFDDSTLLLFIQVDSVVISTCCATDICCGR